MASTALEIEPVSTKSETARSVQERGAQPHVLPTQDFPRDVTRVESILDQHANDRFSASIEANLARLVADTDVRSGLTLAQRRQIELEVRAFLRGEGDAGFQGNDTNQCLTAAYAKMLLKNSPEDFVKHVTGFAVNGEVSLVANQGFDNAEHIKVSFNASELDLQGRTITGAMLQGSMHKILAQYSNGLTEDEALLLAQSFFNRGFARQTGPDAINHVLNCIDNEGICVISAHWNNSGNHQLHALAVERNEQGELVVYNPWGKKFDIPAAMKGILTATDQDGYYKVSERDLAKMINYALVSTSDGSWTQTKSVAELRAIRDERLAAGLVEVENPTVFIEKHAEGQKITALEQRVMQDRVDLAQAAARELAKRESYKPQVGDGDLSYHKAGEPQRKKRDEDAGDKGWFA